MAEVDIHVWLHVPSLKKKTEKFRARYLNEV